MYDLFIFKSVFFNNFSLFWIFILNFLHKSADIREDLNPMGSVEWGPVIEMGTRTGTKFLNGNGG